jgi:hypothetical protein
MDDARSTTKASASPIVAATLILFLVVAPLLYLLSTGPAVWLVQQGYLSVEWMEKVYAPLGYLVDHWKWFEAVMQWYLSFFIDV